mmetsp:Transcript_9464/g.23223  ORF Transcript_9464/g.23223 Transcript_9464/m.23223 type:complete len:235 (+) Transcript_9464:699-1403(+)
MRRTSPELLLTRRFTGGEADAGGAAVVVLAAAAAVGAVAAAFRLGRGATAAGSAVFGCSAFTILSVPSGADAAGFSRGTTTFVVFVLSSFSLCPSDLVKSNESSLPAGLPLTGSCSSVRSITTARLLLRSSTLPAFPSSRARTFSFEAEGRLYSSLNSRKCGRPSRTSDGWMYRFDSSRFPFASSSFTSSTSLRRGGRLKFVATNSCRICLLSFIVFGFSASFAACARAAACAS